MMMSKRALENDPDAAIMRKLMIIDFFKEMSMTRKFQISALILLLMTALLAKSIGSLFAEGALSVSSLAASGNVHFHGTIVQVNEQQGLVMVAGTVNLSDVSGSNNAALLSSSPWNASAALQFHRNANGTPVLNGQGAMVFRVVRTGFTPVLVNANVSNIIGVLIALEAGTILDLDGVFIANSDTGAEPTNNIHNQLLTDVGTLQVEFDLTYDINQTLYAQGTRIIGTETPNGPNTPVMTSQPTIAGPL